MSLIIPAVKCAAEDAAAKKRKEIAEKIRRGEKVHITHTGQLVKKEEVNKNQFTMVVPEGKSA